MQIRTVLPAVVNLMAKVELSTPEHMQKAVAPGILAVHASDFLTRVGQKFGGLQAKTAMDFFKSFIGQYPHIATEFDADVYSVRLCNWEPITERVDGVELRVSGLTAEFYKVNTIHGVLSYSPVRTLRML